MKSIDYGSGRKPTQQFNTSLERFGQLQGCSIVIIRYLFQSISMAIQKGNAVCVMGCVKDRSPGLEGLFNFQVHEAEEL